MDSIIRKKLNFGIGVLILFAVVLFFVSSAPADAANAKQAQGLVEKAKITFGEFMRDPNYSWVRENINHAKGVLIFPQVIKGGFIWGGSGGTGVLMVRDEKTGTWGEPAFYTLGSVTFGLEIGGQAEEVVMLAMTQKAIDSLLSSSFKLGGEASVALGPVGGSANASADIPNVTADFLAFAKAKGLYAGLSLEGAVVAVRDSLNNAYYGKAATPIDIVVKHNVRNRMSTELRESLKCRC